MEYILELISISRIYLKYTPPVTCPLPWQWHISIGYIPAKSNITPVISCREDRWLGKAMEGSLSSLYLHGTRLHSRQPVTIYICLRHTTLGYVEHFHTNV